MPHPSTAVIVTCYNQERFIRQALDSVAAQTSPAAQVVVIDGHSRDRSVAVIERWIEENDFPIDFIAHDRNYGLCATLNQGMAMIDAEFVLTLYGDDWLEPTRIARQAPILAATGDEVSLAVGTMREVDRRGMPLVEHDYSDRIVPLTRMTGHERLISLLTENTIPSPAVLLKAEHVRAAGGYDESLTFDDYDMWLRLLEGRSLVYHSDIVVNYRFLTNSLSRSAERHGDFLLSEARMIFKHAGKSAEADAVISDRLTRTAAALRELGDERRLAALDEMLGSLTGAAR